MQAASLPWTRRSFLATLAAGALARPARAQGPSAANQWFPLRGDDGQPVPNGRAPVELVEEIEDLSGAIWAGPRDAAAKLVEWYDYNCPWCRAAAASREELRRTDPDLRVGLVGNPILSPASRDAALVDLALLRLKGAGASYWLHRRLFALPGRIDGGRALDEAAGLGHDRAELQHLSTLAEVKATLDKQMGLAASLGLVATPSYVVGGATVLGFPGPKAMARIVADVRACGSLVC